MVSLSPYCFLKRWNRGSHSLHQAETAVVCEVWPHESCSECPDFRTPTTVLEVIRELPVSRLSQFARLKAILSKLNLNFKLHWKCSCSVFKL